MTPEVRDIITTFASEGRTPQEAAQALNLYREDAYNSIKQEAGPATRDAWVAFDVLDQDIQAGLDVLRGSVIRSYVDEKIPEGVDQDDFWSRIKLDMPWDESLGIKEQDFLAITNDPAFKLPTAPSIPANVNAGQNRLFSYQFRPRTNGTFDALVSAPQKQDMVMTFPDPDQEQIAGMTQRYQQEANDLWAKVEEINAREGETEPSGQEEAQKREMMQEARMAMAKVAALSGPQAKEFARNEVLVERMKQDDMIDYVGGRGVGDYAKDLMVGLSMFGLGTAQAAAMATGNQEEAEGLAKLTQDIQSTAGSYGVEFSGGLLQRSVKGAGVSAGMMAPALALGPAGRAAGLGTGAAETVALGSLAPAVYSSAYNETIAEADALEQQGRTEEAQVLRNRAGIKAVADTVFELGVERINPFFAQTGSAGWAKRLPAQVFQEAIVEEPLTLLAQEGVSNRIVDRPADFSQLPEVVLSATIATTGMQTAAGAVEMMLPKAPQPMASEVTPEDVAKNVAAAAAGQPVEVNPQAIRPQDTPAIAVAAQTNPETLAAVVAMTTDTTPVATPQSAPVASPTTAPAVTPPEIVAGVEELTDAEALAIDAELGIEPLSAAIPPQQTPQPNEVQSTLQNQEQVVQEADAETEADAQTQEGVLTSAPSPVVPTQAAATQPIPPQTDVQNQMQETGVAPPLEGVPSVIRPEGQTQTGTPQREGQGQEVADLMAVRDNTATPEQVDRLQEQGLAERVDGQTVITQAGIQAMPEAERPRLTEQERRAEIQQQAQPTQPISGSAPTEGPSNAAAAQVGGVGPTTQSDSRAVEVVDKQTSFAPPQSPSLSNQRSSPDPVAKKGERYLPSGGSKEGEILSPTARKRKFDAVGYQRQELEPDESFNQVVSARYGPAIARIRSASTTDNLGGHFKGGVYVSGFVEGGQRGRVIAHELGHASHSLLGDAINKDADVLAEIQAIEQMLYPGLREAVAAAPNADTKFFNYLLSPDEIIAEFNVERLLNPEQANAVAPKLSSLLGSVEKNPRLVVDRSSMPNSFGVPIKMGEKIQVASLQPRKSSRVSFNITSMFPIQRIVEVARNPTRSSDEAWTYRYRIKEAIEMGAGPRTIAKLVEMFPQNDMLRAAYQEAFPQEQPAPVASFTESLRAHYEATVTESGRAKLPPDIWEKADRYFQSRDRNDLAGISPLNQAIIIGRVQEYDRTSESPVSQAAEEQRLSAQERDDRRFERQSTDLQAMRERESGRFAENDPALEREVEAITNSPQYVNEWIQEEAAKAQEEGVQDGDTVVTRNESGETIVGTVAATTGETTTLRTTSGDVTVPTAGLVRQSPQSLSRKPGLAQALMESDGAALQLGISEQDVQRGIAATKRQIPGAQNIWSGNRQAFLDSFSNDPSVQDMVAQLEEGVMTEGFYVPWLQRGFILTDSVIVYQGDADRAALNGTEPAVEAAKRLIRHEVGGHGGWLNLTERQIQDFLNIAKDVIPVSEMNQMIEDGYPFQDWQTNEETFRQAAEEWFSQRLGRLDRLPETGPMARFVEWLKGVWRWLTGRKGDPDLQAIKDLWRQIRMNQAAIATGRAWYSLPREGARAQAVTAKDAEYLAAIEAGDMEKAQRMVDDAARVAGYDIGPVWRGEQSGERPTSYPRRDRREPGVFTTNEKKVADGYDRTGQSRPFYLRGPVLDLRGDEDFELSPGGRKFVVKWAEDADWDFVDRYTGEEVSPDFAVASGVLFDWEGDWSSARWKDLQATAFSEGFNTVILKDQSGDAETGYMDSFVAKDSESLKSADPVTYDSSGAPIPLSQRFKSTSNDIRYSRVRSNAELLARTKEVSFIPMDPETASEQIDVRDSLYASFRGDPDIDKITAEAIKYHPMKSRHVAEAALSMWLELAAEARDPSVRAEMTPAEAVANANTPEEVALAEADHREAVAQAITLSQPVSAEAVARYGIAVPSDYALMGALYARFLPNIERAMEIVLNPVEAERGGFAHNTPQGFAVLVQANIAINQYAQRATPYERNKLKNYQIKIDKVIRSLATEGGRFLVMVGIFKRTLETSGSNVVAALQDMLDKKQQAKIDSVMNVDEVVGEIEKLAKDSDPQTVSELSDEIAALWERMMRTDDIREAEAIADVLKSLMPRRQNAKRQIASLFPQAGIRDRMNQRGTQLVRDFFRMLAGPRDQSGPLAEFDDSIQSALSEMLRKVVKDAGLLSQNESNQPDAVDRIVRSLSSDPLRFDKIEAADALMQQELDNIEDVERREILRQAWEEATAGMMTNIANPSWTRRAVNDSLKAANVTGKQWQAAFETGAPRAQAVAAIKQKAIDDTIRAIESRLTNPGDTTVQRNLAMVQQEIGEAFDQIAEVKYASWLRNRARIAEQKRLSAMRKSILAALRKQKMAQDTVDRLEALMAGTATNNKNAPNPLRDLINAHSRLDVPDFIEQAVAAGLATDDATKLRDTITRYRNSRYLDPDSPLLSTLFNQIKNRVAGDIDWADLISVDQMDGKKRQQEIYKRITNHAALRGMDRAQKIALTKALNRLWVKKKQEVMKRELKKLGLTKSGRDPRVASLFENTANRSIDLTEFRERARSVVPVSGWRKFNKEITNTFREIRSGAMTPEKFDELIGQPRKMMDVDVRNIIDSTPEILRYMNLGMWNAQALRDAISEKYGVKSLDSKEAKEIEDLARQAYNAEPGLPRNKLLVEIMRKMANLEDVSMLQLFQSARISNLLFSWRTFMAAGLTILNSARRLLGLIAYQSISSAMGRTPQRMKASLESSKKFFAAMPEAAVVSLAYLSSGDVSLLPTITNDLENMFASGKFGFSTAQMVQSEKLVKELRNLPARIKRDVKNGDARKVIRDVFSSFWGLTIMSVQRIMGAIDLFVGTTSRESVIPLVAALNPDLFDLKKVLAEQRPEAFKKAYAQAEQELFGRPAKGIKERAEANIRAREFMARIFDPYLVQDAQDFAQETTYQMNPTGVGGFLYSAVNAGFRMVEAGADKLQADLDNKIDRREVTGLEKQASQLAVGALRFIASGIQTELGLRFIRFTGNRINELISLTPVLGLARMLESSIQQSRIKKATLAADQAFAMAFALWAASVIMEEWGDDKEDEERGWYIEGPWSGLTADEKNAAYASGKKPYTFAVRVMGKWQVFNYREWQTAGLFATLGAMMDRKRYQREAWDKQGATGAIVSSMALGLMSFKDMSSMSQLMTLAGNNPYERDPVQGSQDAFGKFAGSFLSSMVPTFTRDIDYIMNPEHRKAEFWHEQAVMRIPFARLSAGQPMLDIFFEPVVVDRGPLSRVVYERTEEPARVALGRLNSADINANGPELENRIVGRGMDARPMTESEKTRFKQRWNRDFKRYLVTNTDRLLRMKRDEAQKKIRDDLNDIKQNIEDEVAP